MFAEGLSKNQLRKFSDSLKSFVRQHAHTVVAPHFNASLTEQFGPGYGRIESSDNGERVRVHYPSALESMGDRDYSMSFTDGVRCAV